MQEVLKMSVRDSTQITACHPGATQVIERATKMSTRCVDAG